MLLGNLKQQVSVSVVVPVFNGVNTIAQTVNCLLRQSYPPTEILIVDDGSTDGTADVLKEFASQIAYIAKPNGGPASARNRGIKSATGDLIAFTDSDCLPDRMWLEYLVSGFDDKRIGGVGGKVLSAEKTILGEYIDETGFLNPQPDERGEIPYLITANACFRREVLLQTGGFSERFRKPGGEEPELCWRIRQQGYRFKFAVEAMVLHHHRQSVRSFFKTLLNYGEGTYVLGQLVADYRLNKPRKILLQKVFDWPSVARRIVASRKKIGLKRATLFSLLDYLKDVAFSLGYLRGEHRAA